MMKTLHARAGDGQRHVVLQPMHSPRSPHVRRDTAAQHDARALREVRERRVEDFRPAFEHDIDALGRERADALRDVLALVVDGGVEPGGLHHPVAFRLAAGDADRRATARLGDLADHRACRPRRARDQHHIARLGLADLDQPEIGGESGNAEDAERLFRRQARMQRRRRPEAAAIGDAVILPAERALDSYRPETSDGLEATTLPHPAARTTSPIFTAVI